MNRRHFITSLLAASAAPKPFIFDMGRNIRDYNLKLKWQIFWDYGHQPELGLAWIRAGESFPHREYSQAILVGCGGRVEQALPHVIKSIPRKWRHEAYPQIHDLHKALAGHPEASTFL